MPASPRTAEQTDQLRAYAILAIGVMSVALAAIFIRLAQRQDVPSLFIATGRLAIAALILTPMTLRRPTYVDQVRGLSQRDFGLLIVSGIFLSIHFAAWVTSLEYTTVLVSVVLVTTTPIWVAILETLLLRARLPQLVIAGMVVALGGSLVIGLGDADAAVEASDPLLGAFLSAVGAVTVAVYFVIGRHMRSRLSLVPYIWIVYGCAACILSVALLVTSTPITGHPLEGYFWIICLGLIPQLIGHSSLNYALAYLPATFVSVATQAEPIGSAIIAAFVFAEIPGLPQIIGSAIILSGVIIASFGQSRHQAAQRAILAAKSEP